MSLVFGQADPRAYNEQPCVCGHYKDEHEDIEDGEPCWNGWTDDEEGCKCTDFDEGDDE